MKTIEYQTQDKTTWGSGPWQDEPDKKQWQDEATGLPCLIVRNGGGAWCGYVGVPKSHPLHGVDSLDVNVHVHGGLTFADKCADLTPDAWDRYKKRLAESADEARRYPIGDAARFIRNGAKAAENFDAFVEYGRSRYICHLPEPGEPDDVWWFGFDCAHSGDASPAYREIGRPSLLTDGQYRDVAYVTREVERLALQLADVPGARRATK